MNQKFKLPLAIAIASAVLVGCSSNKVKEVKPNPLPKLIESKKTLTPVFSRSVSSTDKADPLRLQLDASDGVVFTLDPKGEVAAYRGKQRIWEKKVSKLGLSSGVEAAEGIVVVGNSKGQLFALDQATGEQKWTAQLSGALLSPSLVQSGRVITIANDGTVFAHDATSGQHPLAQLIAACQRYIAKDGNESSRKHVTIEYVMLEGVNDHPEHAQQMIKLLKNLPSKINLIPFNPFPHAPYGRSSRNRIISFQKTLSDAGFVCTIRQTRGDDIDAACGQLVGQVADRTRRAEQWQKKVTQRQEILRTQG